LKPKNIFETYKIEKMKKNEIIEQIRDVYYYNVRWLVAVHAEILDFPINDEITNLTASDCEFAKWHKENTEKLSHFKSFENLGELHEKSHKIYDAIDRLVQKNKTKKFGFFDKLMGRDELIHEKMIYAHYKDLTNVSNKILNGLKELENEILMVSTGKFDKAQILNENKGIQVFIKEDEKETKNIKLK
jgi:hypothetical protein